MLAEINRAGVAVFLVEQNVRAALDLAHRAYLLEHGRVVAGRAEAAEVLSDPGSGEPISALSRSSHERALDVTALAQQLVLGVLLGGLYGLAAAGLSLVFGVLRVLNVAHGELIMLGGYGAFALVALVGLDPFVALLLIIPLAGALGALLYGGVFRFIVRHGEETRIKNSLLVGFGLALTLQAVAVRLFTADERSITTAYRGRALALGGSWCRWGVS